MLIGSPYFLEMIQLLTNILCDQVGILNVSLGVRMHIILPEPIGTRCTVSMPINDVEMRILLSSLCDGGIDFRFPITVGTWVLTQKIRWPLPTAWTTLSICALVIGEFVPKLIKTLGASSPRFLSCVKTASACQIWRPTFADTYAWWKTVCKSCCYRP